MYLGYAASVHRGVHTLENSSPKMRMLGDLRERLVKNNFYKFLYKIQIKPSIIKTLRMLWGNEKIIRTRYFASSCKNERRCVVSKSVDLSLRFTVDSLPMNFSKNEVVQNYSEKKNTLKVVYLVTWES